MSSMKNQQLNYVYSKQKENSETSLVSVDMITYNHEKYIAQAIEGVLGQIVDFKYELVIGEDCSIDGTREICEQYAAKYPAIIKLLPSEKNLGMMENGNRTFLACTGKYIALCEGDDYWTDSYKLQKQVDLLESISNSKLCFHNYLVVNNKNEFLEFGHTDDYKTPLDINDIINGYCPKTCTVVFKKDVLNKINLDGFNYLNDKILWSILLSTGGYAYKISETMACYRYHEGGVWSSKPKHIRRINLINQSIEVLSVVRDHPKSFVTHSELVSLYTESSFDLLKKCEKQSAKNEIIKARSLLFDFKTFNILAALRFRRFYYLFLKRFYFIIKYYIFSLKRCKMEGFNHHK